MSTATLSTEDMVRSYIVFQPAGRSSSPTDYDVESVALALDIQAERTHGTVRDIQPLLIDQLLQSYRLR